MNWKFWTWPGQIRLLRVAIAAHKAVETQLHQIIEIQQKQIERLLEARDAEMTRRQQLEKLHNQRRNVRH